MIKNITNITPLISMGVEAVMCITDELISLCYEGSKLLPAILFSLWVVF